MNVDLISFMVGVLSSVIAVLSVFLINKGAKNIFIESSIILKNEKGETIEIDALYNDSVKDFRSYIVDAIDYEKSVMNILKKLNLDVTEPSHTGDYNGVDFLIKNGDELFAIEVKSHKKPLSLNVIKKSLSRLPKNIKNIFFVSKNGFSNSSIEYLKSIEINVSLISGENQELYNSISTVIQEQGISNK